MRRKFGILIAVRSDSMRLPGKHFKILNDKLKLSVLDYCIKRCKKSKVSLKIKRGFLDKENLFTIAYKITFFIIRLKD